MPSYILANDALLEIQEIVEAIKAENEPAARHWLAELRSKLSLLAAMPRLGRMRDDLIADIHVFPYGNHLIFYDIGEPALWFCMLSMAGRTFRTCPSVRSAHDHSVENVNARVLRP